MSMTKILLLDPNYPSPSKSHYHQDILPNALLKLGAYYKSKGYEVKLLRLSEQNIPIQYNPDKICITSLFTYWIDYVRDAVDFAREFYPSAFIEVGGICATLQPEYTKQYTNCDRVICGPLKEVDEFQPDYSLLKKEPNFQIITTSRGCNRKCYYCGVQKVEPTQTFKKTIKNDIFKRNLIFYDNNLLANPYIENILRELIMAKRTRKILRCDSISGFDGRILRKKPHLAKWLRAAGFKNPKIAWDSSIKTWNARKRELDILVDAKFRKTEISVFMLFNHELTFEECEKKRVKLYNYGVQITGCRFRPYDQYYDSFYGKWNEQTSDDYYIHDNWTDEEVRVFNSNVRRHNTCIRYESKYYSNAMFHKKVPYEQAQMLKKLSADEAREYLDDVVDLSKYTDCR